MTFSDRRIVEFVTKHFIPVWESVAPVSIATFELGDGRILKGTVGGEIAVFFCLPDGRTFDILPALQSPTVTLRAIEAARKAFEEVRTDPEPTITARHAKAIEGVPTPIRPKNKETLADRLRAEDAATRTLSKMMFSKSAVITGEERFVVVEPAGLSYYMWGVHWLLSQSPLRSPQELRKPVFEGVLEMKLEARNEVFTTDSSPEPFMFVDEEE